MNFPTTYQYVEGSLQVVPDDGRQLDHADGGKLRARILYDRVQYRITFQLIAEDATEYTAIMKFYTDYSASDIQWADPHNGIAYGTMFAAVPRRVSADQCSRSVIEFQLAGEQAEEAP